MSFVTENFSQIKKNKLLIQTSVKASVHFQTSLGGEQLVTRKASVSFDACVSLEVSGQSALDGKRSEAVRAFVRLFVGVYSYVTYQIAWLLKFFCAVNALVPPNPIYLEHVQSTSDRLVE